MKDEVEQIAERLLPCDEQRGWCNLPLHWGFCPANFRPAVAAALREAQEEIQKWRAGVLRILDALGATRPQIISFDVICAEVAKFRAEANAERDAAYRHIQAEIDKAKAGK